MVTWMVASVLGLGAREFVRELEGRSFDRPRPSLAVETVLPEADPDGSGGTSTPSTELGHESARPAWPRALLDPNVATIDELVSLPGIGPSKAQAIVAYRARHGRFKDARDLMRVKGIGPKTVEALRPLLRFDAR